MSSLRFFPLPLAAIVLCLAFGVAADEPETAQAPADSVERDYSDELPRIDPLEPDEALESFELRPGFRLDQVAAEPLVADPVAMAFDADGRLYVVEMRGYSENPDDALSRVSLLEDTDNDGRFDKSTPFLEGLSWPTAITCFDDGVFVGDAPDIFFARDTNGDGRADERIKVFTGFSTSNVQGLLNSFHFGLDNRIHGATSTAGGEIETVATPAELWGDSGNESQPTEASPKLNLRGRDFAFDPRTLKLEATSGGAQHGMSFDDWGRKFASSNSDHIQQVMFDDHYLARNAYLAAPGARRSVASDGPQAEVFRISPVEPWRIVRTRLRKQAIVPGPVEGGGRAAGYFTGATGVTIYRGDAFPDEYYGNAFVGDVGSNIVHRKTLSGDGIELTANRAEEGVEFLASRDIWFRPAQFANAPDGGLYVMDVYREVIEHPASLHPVIKKHLDLTNGRDRGRIYRVVPEGYQHRPTPKLSQADTAEQVALLAHPNGWHRDTAARLLFERQDKSAIPLLREMVTSSESPFGRMRALYVLDGMNALDESSVIAGLNDASPRVQEHAVRLSEPFIASSPSIQERLLAMVDTDDQRLRYQLAFSLGEMEGPKRDAALAALLINDPGSKWMRLAVLSSLSSGTGNVLSELVENENFRTSPGATEVLSSLATQIGLTSQPEDIAALFAALKTLPDDDDRLAPAMVEGLSEGLSRSGRPVQELLADNSDSRASELLTDVLNRAEKTAEDESKNPGERAAAVATLSLAPLDDARDLLAELLDNRQPQEVQLAALSTLAKFRDAEVAELLIEAWPGFSPRLRVEASEVLFARTVWIEQLLDALDSGDILPVDLEPARVQQLREHGNKAIRERSLSLLAEVNVARRGDVVEAYRPALSLSGNVESGRQVFRKICAACHKAENVGHELGPNLATIKNRGPEFVLLNVLDPNREVNPQYANYVVITEDGRSLSGMLTGETANSVTLTRAEGASDTVLRVDIDELRSTGLSIMPEGMEKQIDQQALADLIAYINALE